MAIPAILSAQADLDDQVRSIAAQLRCPVCQNLSVGDSPSEMAQEMRGVIREQLQSGKTPEEVKAYFLSKYGDWILLSPRPRGLSLLIWVGPFVGAAAGIAAVFLAVRRWARRTRSRERPAADPALLERVRREALSEDAEIGAGDREVSSPLEVERNNLYAALRELDFDYRSGKLSRADYDGMREEYEGRAAAVLREMDQLGAAPPPAAVSGASAQIAEPKARPRRHWRFVAGGVFLLIFGVSLGYFLTQSLKPRTDEQSSITGDLLTGTSPGGVASGQGPARQLPALMASGRAAYEKQEWRTAIEAFRQALTLDPENSEAHTFLGLILFNAANHTDGALLAFERALAKDPNYPFALWAKGLVLFEAKQDYSGAIKTWEALMAQKLSEAEADRVAQMLAEARKRLAAGPAGTPPAR